MMLSTQHFCSYLASVVLFTSVAGCAGDALQSGLDPFAPMVFKEGVTVMPLNPPNQSTLTPFYVSQTTVFKFAIDLDSILIGADGVTRYTVVIINPSGGQQAQYEGIRCDSSQARIYGNYYSTGWKENPLSSWKVIQSAIANRYQAALAQGAFCNIDMQEKNIETILKSLNPKGFTGQNKPSNSMGVIIGY
ncbi:CNP1-like family protein [Polynucleobacter sp. AP-Melu-500A-A1]|uniref:CNP1-like family protein n=1 Tax=Polynucleobacter sp. AP-Melu-500A-A1 TaxID=2576929 RepID=UPI001C0E8CB8|nr:CNP1-like family protein [Polynucleobacter sp. AP-Melu-500A-A1]MBU3629919.1 CNP1-like family protein [Polynucleobacter sp. AP-Melu-500A-A1]